VDNRQAAQLLIDQLADEIDLAGLAFDDEGLIELQVGEGKLVTIAVDPTEDALLLVANVAGPLDGLPAATLRRLLQRNAAAYATGAAFSAVDPGTRHLILQQQLPLPGLGYTAFSDALKAIIAEQDRLSDELVPQLASVAPSTLDGSSAAAGAGIRV
jgi:hypothetical protein